MAVIKINLPVGETVCCGKQITFRAPSQCTEITALNVNGVTYQLVDACGKSTFGCSTSFTKGAMVSVLLDTETSKAFLLNPGFKQMSDDLQNTLRIVSFDAETGTLITKSPGTYWFTYVGDYEGGEMISCQFEEGMTWAEFCDSEYNTRGFEVVGSDGLQDLYSDGVCSDEGKQTSVLPTDVIKE